MSGPETPASGPGVGLSSANNQVSTFSQQGTIDWVNLGQMQFSASIAILGRLSRAGIDPLTIAFGQAMCCLIPLGLHGEQVLHRHMEKLKAFSSFGDVVWFGVGVRHVLRDLVQTTQGAALVALCATLAEGYGAEVSALVLYEIARLSGGPNELRPSFAQWKALMEVSGSVFTSSTFGLRIEQLRRLDGISTFEQSRPSHPVDLARVIIAIGKVMNGRYQSISVQGGSACSWVAAWADFVLGLRVKVQSSKGELIFVNYQSTAEHPQLIVDFQENPETLAMIRCTSNTMAVRDGATFIRECISRMDPRAITMLKFKGGRVSWERLLQDTFGGDFQELLTTHHRLLTSMLACGAATFTRHTSLAQRFDSVASFISWMLDFMPELQRIGDSITIATQGLLECDVVKEHKMALQELGSVCYCWHCQPLLNAAKPERVLNQRQFCWAKMTETILIVSYLGAQIVLDHPLYPTRRGILRYYKEASHPSHMNKHPWWTTSQITKDPSLRLTYCARLFGDHNPSYPSNDRRCAISKGDVYSYVETLRGLTDSASEAFLIHVGPGSIEYASKLHQEIWDLSSSEDDLHCYPAKKTMKVTDMSALATNLSISDFIVEAIVTERVDIISFCYRISSTSGVTTISPAKLAEKLMDATAYLTEEVNADMTQQEVQRVVYGHNSYLLVEGEGAFEEKPDGLILRPLRSNTVGRCIAIYRSQQHTALITNETQLEHFARFWWHHLEQKRHTPNEITYYALVS